MATDTFAARGKVRWYPRWAAGLLAAALALVALALIAVEVVMPLSSGLPVGWGQYSKAEYHLRIGTPPFWNVIADNTLYQGATNSCTLAVVASPLSGPALRSTRDALKAPRWMGVSVCNSSAGADMQASLWAPTGQTAVVAGQRVPVQMETIGAPQVSERVVVSLHGYMYDFMLQEPTAAEARQDMPDFLSFVRSFRYVN